ncbi:E3 ubiquitin-protein ligase MBR2 [Camellia lanceoleosa]|uniref:E3 ubiquitin-protein ligase MBR2 n=1 Tax=Camellia lanceoleosa TaxID=1840588 RepID=A0ACC0HDT2_9ERIC|nr:E3 ubiquitin-protein ligase MBR2 [Camellia lanceoleosa]
MQAMRGNNLDLQPQVPSSSNRHQTNNNPRQHNASNSSWDSHDDGYRNFGPSTRQGNSIVTFDRFAIQLVDELLDLEEQMGHINTGLSEETIIRNLKVRTHISSVRQLNLNEVPSLDQEPEICTICQGEYENYDTIGSLGCGHDYHAVCIKKWLQEKNVCPLCKSTALTIKG